MKVLVINSGSSSIKYRLFDMDDEAVLASGLAERIGEAQGALTHRAKTDGTLEVVHRSREVIADHRQGLAMIVACLVHQDFGVIADTSELDAVGHRVVHGGETFKAPAVIDGKVIQAIEANVPLAPLHNPPNLTGIEVARSIFAHAVQVAVFDTAFHQSLPPKAFLYAIPYRLYQEEGVRRYGFHGTSHAYVAQEACRYLGRAPEAVNLISIHLGNGASMAAIQGGRCVDTSMGMTPLEGLVMGTRCGDVDPALPFFLADHLKLSLGEIDTLLNQQSGLKGLCGMNDMREVATQRRRGDEQAEIAMQVYCYRIKKYIGAYHAVLGRVDALVFTGGIGENAADVRALSVAGLHAIGIELDRQQNTRAAEGIRDVGIAGARVRVLVVPTNEELRIARETARVVRELREDSGT